MQNIFIVPLFLACLLNVSYSAENRLENQLLHVKFRSMLLYCSYYTVCLSIFIQNYSFLRFSLYYYSGNVDTDNQSETLLIIDTRNTKNIRNRYVNLGEEEEEDEDDDDLGSRQVDYLEVVLGTK